MTKVYRCSFNPSATTLALRLAGLRVAALEAAAGHGGDVETRGRNEARRYPGIGQCCR